MTDTMTAVRFDVQSRALTVKSVPIPALRPGSALVKVAAAGVCLSDVHIPQGHIVPRRVKSGELTLGHEVSGTVEAVADDVAEWTIGERVTVQPVGARADGNHTIGVDYDGGWAEYVLTPASTLEKIPDGMSFEVAAIIPDAVSTPWSAITSTAQVRPGETVGVCCVGGLGAHAIQLLRLVGAAPIVAVDPVAAARTRALVLGADVALDPTAPDFAEALATATYGHLFDVALDFAGVSASQHQPLASLAPYGRLALVGMSSQPITIADSNTFNFYQRQILGHFGLQTQHIPQLIRLTSLGRLDLTGSISEILPLADAAEAMRRLDEKIGDPIRIVLRS
jgi:D-arabinose 1-dehydrogenase-like Zn-dependent alcohol dehydrogenase